MSREPKANPQHGRKANQKMKPYLVMEYLMRHTDENHAESADNIVAYLQELGIDAERRSIYRDIEEINKALWLLENADDDATIPILFHACVVGVTKVMVLAIILI